MIYNSKKSPSVFIGLHEVAGNYTYLERGFKAIGTKCIHVDLFGESFFYGKTPKTNSWMRLIEHIGVKRRQASKKGRIARVFWRAYQSVFLPPLFIWAILNFDHFIFGYGKTFFPRNIDLQILRFFRKKIVLIFHGSDCRPPYMDGAIMSVDSGRSLEDCASLTKKTKNHVRRLEQLADFIVAPITIAQFFTKPVLDVLHLGKPFAHNTAEASTLSGMSDNPSGLTRILHAPTHLEAKGTPEIRLAIDRLKNRGFIFEYVEITGRPHADVVKELSKADFVIDQLYSDIYMSSFAKEAAFLGKPAIVGGRFAEHYKHESFRALDPPVHICLPEDIETAIEYFLLNPEYRASMGESAYKFVTENWHCNNVAARYLNFLKDNKIYETLATHPEMFSYQYGCGMSVARLKEIIQSMITKFGISSLELDKNAPLLSKLQTMAKEPDIDSTFGDIET